MSDYVLINGQPYRTDELMHFGVKGMKWGHRKKYYNSDGSLNRLGQAKQNYKTAKKEADKAYSKAHNYSAMHPISQFTKRKRIDKSNALWKDQYNKEAAKDKAKKEYKAAKKERRSNIKKAYKEINKQSSLAEKMIFNDATRRGAAKYVVDHNMSIDEARQRANKDAVRNTTAVLAVYGAVTVASLYKNRK